VAGVGVVVYLGTRHRSQTVEKSGIVAYEEPFEVDRTREVLADCEREYRYYGVSFASVREQVLRWHETHQQCKLRLLVSDPGCDEALEFQARHEMGFTGPEDRLTADQKTRIAEHVEASKARIRETLHELKKLNRYGNRVQVRLHGEKLRIWMHLVDAHTLYLGVLRQNEIGRKAPMLVLERKKKWSLFDHYAQEWDSMWDVSKEHPLESAAPGEATQHRPLPAQQLKREP
jgi:hypothetical protein